MLPPVEESLSDNDCKTVDLKECFKNQLLQLGAQLNSDLTVIGVCALVHGWLGGVLAHGWLGWHVEWLSRIATMQIGEGLSDWLEQEMPRFPPAFFRTQQQLFKHINRAYKDKVMKARKPNSFTTCQNALCRQDGPATVDVAYRGTWWHMSPKHQCASPFSMGNLTSC